MWKSFDDGILAITTDSALVNAIENPNVAELDDDVNSSNWLALSCATHNCSNILKECFRLMNKEMSDRRVSNFEEDLSKITSLINSADKRKTRNNEMCAKSYNDLIADMEVSAADKIEIAKIKHLNYDELSEEEKSEILEGITNYPSISPIFHVRFRTWYDSLKALKSNKGVIKASCSSSGVHSELFDGDLNWELVDALYEAFGKIVEKIDYFERDTASISHHIKAYLDIISFSLPKSKAWNER